MTTGVSSSERMHRQLLAKELKRLLQSKAKGGTQLKCDAVFEEVRQQSQVGITQQQFDAALRILRDEDFLVVAGQTIRLS